MSLEILKCPNCGAPMPTTVVEAVVVCAYCTRSVANPAAMRVAPPPAAPHAPPAAPQAPPAAPQAPAVAQQPAAPAAKPAAPTAPETAAEPAATKPVARPAAKPAAKGDDAPAATEKPSGPGAKVGGGKKVNIAGKSANAASGSVMAAAASSLRNRPASVEEDEDEDEDEEDFEWTEESIVALARESLGQHDSLFFDPSIPKEKLKAARGVHKGTLDRDERVLVLFDDTVFGGADDGFIVTTEQLAWKNIMEDPKHFAWDEIDADEVEWSEEGLTVMGEAIQVSQADGAVMYPALGEFIYEMASMAADLEEEDE